MGSSELGKNINKIYKATNTLLLEKGIEKLAYLEKSRFHQEPRIKNRFKYLFFL